MWLNIKKIKVFSLFFLLLYCSGLNAQQYHFSQYFASPLSVNPALTGYFDGNMRLTSVYRNQWAGDNNPFTTIAASAETKLFQKTAIGKFGIGLLLNSDRSNNNALTVNNATLSIAYNLPLDADENIELGVGFQEDYSQRRINPYNLSFESQFVSGGFNPSILTPEMTKASTTSYFGTNAGLMLNVKTSQTDKIYFGAAIYHANQPKINLLDSLFRQPSLLTFNAGTRFSVSTSFHIQLSTIYSVQQQSSETLLGGIGIFDIDEQKTFQFGGWYRLNDAIIPYVGLSWNGIEFGLSYDVTISTLAKNGNLKNSIEFSLRFNQPSNSQLKKLIPWY